MALIDVAILVGLREELRYLRSLIELDEVDGGTSDLWYRGRVDANNGKGYEIVVSCQHKMGPLDAAHLTRQVISRWDPSYLILIGIAGSFDKQCRLGDVLVSQQVFYYDLGKATASGISYRPEGYPCHPLLIRQLDALLLSDEDSSKWEDACLQRARQLADSIPSGETEEEIQRAAETRESLQEARPKVHFGTIASGSLVVASESKRQELKSLHGKLLGTEMEGAGMLHEAFLRDIPLPALVVKGVSDHSDDEKTTLDDFGAWRTLATENAVRLVLAMLARGRLPAIGTDQFVINTRDCCSPAETAKKLTPPYSENATFIGFPRLIQAIGPITGGCIALTASNGSGPLTILDVVVVATHGGNADALGPTTKGPLVTPEIKLPVIREPNVLGLYASIDGAPDHLTFEVAIGRHSEVVPISWPQTNA